MKKTLYALALTGLVITGQQASAQKSKTTPASTGAAKINTATWKEYDLAAYTHEGRIPLTIKLPANIRLKQEKEDGFGHYYLTFTKALSFSVLPSSNEYETAEADMAEMKQNIEKMKKAGFTCKVLADEPDLLLYSLHHKQVGKVHLLLLQLQKPGGAMRYRLSNVASSDPKAKDIYSDQDWLNMARALQTATVH